ncbi:MAG: biotin/lipoyl-containing protein, partial [Opitutaceae bacterium]
MSKFLIDIPIPSMGATVNEITLIDLHASVGKPFAKGERLAEFESDKSVFEFEAPCEGTPVRTFCLPGDIVPVNAPFLRVETADASLKHLEVKAGETQKAVAKPELVGAGATSAKSSYLVQEAPATSRPAVARPIDGRPAWTPRALKIVREAGLDPMTLDGVPATGPGGRVSGDDIEKFLAARGPGETPAARAAAAPRESAGDGTVCVAGIGYAVPRNVRSNEEILKAFPGKTDEDIIA